MSKAITKPARKMPRKKYGKDAQNFDSVPDLNAAAFRKWMLEQFECWRPNDKVSFAGARWQVLSKSATQVGLVDMTARVHDRFTPGHVYLTLTIT